MNAPIPIAQRPASADCGLFPEGPLRHQLLFLGSFSASMAALTLSFSLRTAGTRNMPMHGPVLVVANHQSFLDPPLVGLAARRELVYLARKTLFKNRYFAALIRAYNAVPIDQDGIGKDGIRIILDQLQRRRGVLIFPEGERTPHGGLQGLKPGIHLLIRRAEAAIVPVGIAGAFDAWPRSQLVPKPAPLFWPTVPGTIGVAIGEAEDTRRYASLPREQALKELHDRIAAAQREAERVRRK